MWADYCAFFSRNMIALDKHTGIHPVDAEETWLPLFSKCILSIMGSKATNACKYYQLCAVLKELIYGAVFGMQDLLGNNLSTDNRVFSLFDAKNELNEINQIKILCAFLHLQPSVARFFLTVTTTGPRSS